MLTFLSNNWIWFILCAAFVLILSFVFQVINMKNMNMKKMIAPLCLMIVGGFFALFAAIGIIIDIIRYFNLLEIKM